MPYRKAWAVAYQRDRAAGRARYVDAEPSRARLAELSAAGVPLRTLARAARLSDTAVRAILTGSRQHVQSSSATRIAQLTVTGVYDGQDGGHVPRVGAVRRVQALMALGWRHEDLAAAGVSGTPGLLTRPGQLVTLRRWRQVHEVYDRLSMLPGPSPQTRGWALARGYAPPLAWDEDVIDDPAATPRGEARRGPGAEVFDEVAVRRTLDGPAAGPPLTGPERAEVVRALTEAGASDARIARRLGATDRTVLRIRHRHDIASGRPPPRMPRPVAWAQAAAATARPGLPALPGPGAGGAARSPGRSVQVGGR